MIEALVFEGGGVKGAAYAGAVEILQNKGVLEGVRRIAGASAGSITATMLATGANSDALHRSVTQTNFHDFISDRGGLIGEITRIASHYGLHNGDAFVEILKGQIEENCGAADITFQELYDKSQVSGSPTKELFVVASNLSRMRAQVFSKDTSPDLEVWKAVRASIGIPFIFEPFKIGDSLFVDGGLSWNYPIDIFDGKSPHFPTGQEKGRTLGFYLSEHDALAAGDDWGPEHVAIGSLKEFCLAVGTFMYETSNRRHLHLADVRRTVFIDDLGVEGADFATPENKIESLIESGRKATSKYFAQTEQVQMAAG